MPLGWNSLVLGMACLWPLLLAAAPLRGEPLRISAADCATLVAYRPVPDVDYKGGQDARGRPVEPADLGGASPLALPDAAHFVIEVDLIERLGLSLDPAEIGADLPLGVVTVQGNEVRFNGQPLAPSVGQELADLCRAALAAAEEG